MQNKKIFILAILVTLPIITTSVFADNHQNEPDFLLSINIYNLKTFYEFNFNSRTNKIEKIHEAKVDKIETGERHQLIIWTTGFGNRYMKKSETRKENLKKYRHIFPIDDASLVEISDDGKYIAYTPKLNNQIIYIASLPDNKFQRTISPSKGSYITDIEWTDDTIGMITVHSRMGLGPLELLSASAGHAVFHDSLYLELYSLKNEQHKNFTILENIINGRGLLIK